jgi:DNA processing protein
MESELERAAFVALLRCGRRTQREYAALVADAGSALKILKREGSEPPRSPQPTLFDTEPPSVPQTADATTLLHEASDQIAAWTRRGFQLVTVFDPEFPENLRAAHDRPPLIFVAGELKPEDARSIAVIGTRKPTDRGMSVARAIAAHLVESGFTVVSGLATGIDTAAHQATMAARGRTLAVIGTGLAHSYPPQNASLQRRIAREGAVISQFWPDAPPKRQSFPMRNGVMSGLTLATVIVEASVTSGARIQARLALGQGRPVFLVRSLLTQPWARELARRPGTHVVGRPDEITEIIGRLTAADALTG